MGELILAFVLTFLVLIGLVLALKFGRVPSYRPDRDSVLKLLHQVVDGTADVRRWDLFLGMPIQHDEILESVRVQCVVLHEGLDGQPPAREGLDGQVYDRAGREKIAEILTELEKTLSEEPITREF